MRILLTEPGFRRAVAAARVGLKVSPVGVAMFACSPKMFAFRGKRT
jgi:hypothetical protein